ncbi:MAG: helix-turn-helix transcriptional regulator, partial [bacterium]|nr:helix-turn-helix transcriptional regulator [bacterium]
MNTREKIQLILNLSELTQTELAGRLGVTFAALNRWINNKAVPRKNAQKKIDELYRECSGEKIIPKTLLEAKKNIVAQKNKKH